MSTTVANIRGRIAEFAANPLAVYVGRTGWYAVTNADAAALRQLTAYPAWLKEFRTRRVWLIGKFSNSYRVGRDGERGECVALFKQDIRRSRTLMDEVREELADKVLLCWCAPEPCHANVLAEIADAPADDLFSSPAASLALGHLAASPAPGEKGGRE